MTCTNMMAHHVPVVALGIHTLFFLPPQYPVLSIFYAPTVEHLSYIPINSHQCVFIMAYMFFDMFQMYFITKDKSALAKQMYIHHVVVIVMNVLALTSGYLNPRYFSITFVCELSSIPIIVRNLKGKT